MKRFLIVGALIATTGIVAQAQGPLAEENTASKPNNVTLNEQLGCDRLVELSLTGTNGAAGAPMECARVKERVNGEQSRCFLYGVGIYALNQPADKVQPPKEVRKAVFKACLMLTYDLSEAKAEQVLPKAYEMVEHSSFREEVELYTEIGRTKTQQAAEIQRKKNAELAAAEAKIQALPVNRLLNGYMAFGYVRFCHESREGYLVQYVNDVELKKAERAVKAIVEQTTKEDPSLDTDRVWQEAQSFNNGRHLNEGMCREALMDLFKRSPVALHSTDKPQ